MKAMNKKWAAALALLLGAAILAAVCPLSLAQTDDGADRSELAGVFVRLQPNGWEEDDDFFEFDEQALLDYMKDHMSDLSGDETTLPDELGQSVHVVRDEERNLCMLWEDSVDEDGLRSTGVLCGPIFSDVSQHISVTDDGESVEVSANVYIDMETAYGDEALLTICPVYRRPDGLLCAAPDGGLMGILDGYSVSYETKAERTDEAGNQATKRLLFKVSVKAKPLPGRVTLVEMSADNQPLASREIDLTREELVETVSPEAAWALVEQSVTEKMPDEDPVNRLVREAVSLDDGEGEITLYLPSEVPGLLAPRALSIVTVHP